MSERITEKNLQACVERINKLTDSPLESYRNVDGKHVSNVGNYHLDFAYGGVSLERMCNEAGGVSDVFRVGHVSKRELWELMHAFIAGHDSAKSKGQL